MIVCLSFGGVKLNRNRTETEKPRHASRKNDMKRVVIERSKGSDSYSVSARGTKVAFGEETWSLAKLS